MSSGGKKNRLLIKDRVGKVKTSHYDLPTGDFTFGKKIPKDAEGADAVLSWVEFQPSAAGAGSEDIISRNRNALRAGCLDARSASAFGRDPENKVLKRVEGKKDRGAGTKAPFHDGRTFGQVARPSTPISDCIGNMYAPPEEQEESDYADMSGKRKKGKLPTPKATRASRGQDVHLVGTSTDRKVTEAKKPFKLSRFENIRSKGLY